MRLHPRVRSFKLNALLRSGGNRIDDRSHDVLAHLLIQLPAVLHYFDELPFREVAQVLGVSETAARVRLHRALKRLRDRLGPASVTGEALA